MRKFGGLGTGKSPLRQRPQPKNSMTSLASLAEMVGQANEDDYSNIKLCLNSDKPQLELEQSHTKNWRNQSPLRRGLNKENDFNQFGNRNIFEANRFADCLIKQKPQTMLKGPSPILGNLLSKNRQDVSPGKQRKLQQNDFVFRAGSSNISKGMNFSEISRKFNEQEDNNELLSYAPSLEQSRPKSRTKAPKLQKQFDQDDFGDIKQSIRQDEFTHKRMMNAGQKQRFENKIEQIKQEKMKLLKDKQHNKTLLPKIIEEIKANATRQIQQFAIYLFNQSKKQQDESLLEPETRFPKKSYEERVQEKPKVIIGAKHHIKPIESHISKVNNSSQGGWGENQLPLVQSEYPQDAYEIRDNTVKIGSPNGIRLEPQPTKLVRGLDLGNSKDVIGISVKEIGLQFSKKQNDLVLQLQKKREEEERVTKQREQQQRERQRQQDLMQQMQAKRKKFQQDARLRQQEANRLEQQRIAREQQKFRLENQQRLRRQEQFRKQEIERQRQLEQEARRIQEERLRVEQQERERQNLLRRLEEQRLAKERKQVEQRQIERQKLEAQRIQLERIQQQLRQADERAKAQAEKIERQRKQQQQFQRIRLESERIRLEAQRLEREKIQLERIQNQRREIERERERLETQRIQNERRQREEKQQRQRQIEAERKRVEQQKFRQEQELRKFQLERLEREQAQRRQKLRRQAQQDQLRRKRVFEQYQAERKREQAQKLVQLQKQKAQKQRLQREKLTSAPINTSFKFDLGGDDLKTSFKFDNLFTNFSLGTPEPAVQQTPVTTFTPSVVSAPLTSLDDLTSNAVKQSINVTSSKAMDFKFDFGLDMDVASSRKFI